MYNKLGCIDATIRRKELVIFDVDTPCEAGSWPMAGRPSVRRVRNPPRIKQVLT